MFGSSDGGRNPVDPLPIRQRKPRSSSLEPAHRANTAARHSYPLGAAMVPPSFGNVNCETAWTTLASGLDETPEQPVADEYGNEPRTPTRSGRPMRPS